MMIKASFFHKKEALSFNYTNDPVCFVMLLFTYISMEIILTHITFIKFEFTKPQKALYI